MRTTPHTSPSRLPPGQIPTRRFQVVGEKQPAPGALDERAWRLIVTGLVAHPFELTLPDGFLCEYPITPRTWDATTPAPPSPMMTELTKSGVVVEDGYARVPEGPGLGIELDEDAVARYTVDETDEG